MMTGYRAGAFREGIPRYCLQSFHSFLPYYLKKADSRFGFHSHRLAIQDRLVGLHKGKVC